MQELRVGINGLRAAAGGKDGESRRIANTATLIKTDCRACLQQSDSFASPGFCRDEAYSLVQRDYIAVAARKPARVLEYDGKNRPRDAVNRHRNSRELGRKR